MRTLHIKIKRHILAGILVALAICLLTSNAVIAAPTNSSPNIKIDTSQATPREVEEQTAESIVRDYGNAWKNLAQALEKNQADVLAASFVGIARDQLAGAIAGQASSGLSRKLVDHGHQLHVVFYPVEGSAMQLRDTAQLEVQYLENGKVIHSERLTSNYLVLMTPGENSWKVRILQELPSGTAQQAANFRVSGEETGSK